MQVQTPLWYLNYHKSPNSMFFWWFSEQDEKQLWCFIHPMIIDSGNLGLIHLLIYRCCIRLFLPHYGPGGGNGSLTGKYMMPAKSFWKKKIFESPGLKMHDSLYVLYIMYIIKLLQYTYFWDFRHNAKNVGFSLEAPEPLGRFFCYFYI